MSAQKTKVFIDEGNAGPNARLEVRFYNVLTVSDPETATPIATMWVKNEDRNTPKEIDKIIYDPGVGALQSQQLFQGWAINPESITTETKTYTIQGVRDYIAGIEENWKEGDVLNVYAVIFKYFTVTYFHEVPLTDDEGNVMTDENDQPIVENVSLGSDNLLIANRNATSGTYTVKYDFTPSEATQNFEGWDPIEGAENISGHTEGKLYQRNEQITLSGNVSLMAHVTNGYWLIFKENGKGATYNAPKFFKNGETLDLLNTTDSDDEKYILPMIRLGYTFGGWYKDEACTEPFSSTTAPYTFSGVLTENTTIYAKWTANPTANYTVIIWTENIECDGYDVKESFRLSGNTNTVVSSISQQGTGNNAYARITGRPAGQNVQYTGFHLKEFDQNVTIKAEGNSVVNVYYDRTEYTFTFRATRYGNNIHSFSAKYGTSISDKWTFTGSNGVSYPQTNPATSWHPFGSSTYTARITHMETMPAESLSFYHETSDNPTRYFHYYVEALPGATNTRTFNGKQYSLYYDLTHNFGIIFYEDDFWQLQGYTREAIATANGTDVTNTIRNASNGAQWQNAWNSNLYFYYTRNTYSISYFDGVYVDGNGAIIDDQDDRGLLHTSSPEAFNANLSEYNKGGDEAYTPTFDGFVFEGWYIDKACVTPYTFDKMPEGGITVYAKWRIIQYRVFLHSNAITTDSQGKPITDEDGNYVYDDSLSWGSDDQAMSFRRSVGDSISLPKGLRDGYEMIGWYFDAEGKDNYPQSTVFNESLSYLATYDKTVDLTDVMDKHGNIIGGGPDGNGYNSDLVDDDNNYALRDRWWITKKLDLYAKWGAKIEGALGIKVEYDANGGTYPEGTDNVVVDPDTGNYILQDPTFYGDNVDAAAQAASTAPEGKKFSHWVVQTYNENTDEYEDVDINVYPGGSFTILKANAKQVIIRTHIDKDTGKTIIDEATYTIRLRAEYIDEEPLTPTHITFYANGGKIALTTAPEDAVIGPAVDSEGPTTLTYPATHINESVYALGPTDVSREGFKFVGWAKSTEPNKTVGEGDDAVTVYAFDPETGITDESMYEEIDGLDVWLKVNVNESGDYVLDDDGHFTFTEVGTANTKVTKVAADEVMPYDSLYAVWEKTFYVYHSYTKVLEAVSIDTDTFDITQKVDSQCIYGGYYKSFGGVTVSDSHKAEALEYGSIEIDSAEQYTGASLTTEAGTRFWSKRVKVGSEYENNYYAEYGKNMVPEVGTVYYLKEVPAAYLSNNIKYIQNIDTDIISDLYMLTTVDDTLYNAFGFEIEVDIDEPVKETLVLFNTVTVQQRGLSGDKTTVKTFQAGVTGDDTPLNTGISRGYIGYLNKSVSSIKDSEEADLVFVLRPYWKTLDGVVVYGIERTYTIGADNKTISAE